MIDTEMQRRRAICFVAGVDNIGELSDGFHTFNSLYEQRMILFAALVRAYRGKAWKSYRHEDGEYCFGGGWFIVGIDTPEGSYTYHYENKYWDMFDCPDLPRGKHWDGHTDADAETRLMSLEPESQWIPVSKKSPEEAQECWITTKDGTVCQGMFTNRYGARRDSGFICNGFGFAWINAVAAWMPFPEPYQEESEQE